MRLAELRDCFQGVIPSILATASADGEPNVTYISQVHYVDEAHVALSCQFFNKTRRNIAENPRATVNVYHPVTLDAWRLRLRFDHSETEGLLFEKMALRIQVIASHTGMSGVFRLISADVFDVLELERIDGFLLPAETAVAPTAAASDAHAQGPLTELRGLQVVSERIARAADLDGLLTDTLAALDDLLGFSHTMVLVPADCPDRFVAIASRGYEEGIGAEVALGEGIIGTAADRRRMIRLSSVGAELRYGRAIRSRVEEHGHADQLAPEIPLPGLPDAQAQLALPLLAGERLIGVLAVESRDPLCFDEWDEAFLQIVANQIAIAIDRMQSTEEETAAATLGRRTRKIVYYRNDDCVFADGEYLVRNVPAKILWKVLRQHQRDGQIEFTNRELRLDPSLGLPPLKDNLESRLILLRKRLSDKCPDIRIVPVRRGRFALQLDCDVELTEKECG